MGSRRALRTGNERRYSALGRPATGGKPGATFGKLMPRQEILSIHE